MKLVVEHLTKSFGNRQVIRDINFTIESPDSLVISGPNGSGKTTLIRMICGLLSPTSGGIHFYHGSRELTRDQANQQIGLVGPYLQFYKDLTGWENLDFFARARCGSVNKKRIFDLLEQLGLKGRHNDELKAYSSGMLQRIKYVAALYHRPGLLILDEPTANLDETGKQQVYEIIAAHKKENIVIIATNEKEELQLGRQRVVIA